MNKKILFVFLVFFICIWSKERKRLKTFPFCRGQRHNYMDNIFQEWAIENDIKIRYQTIWRKGNRTNKKVFETASGVYSCLTHLAKDFPELDIPCAYCGDGTIVKGSNYLSHQASVHSRNRKKRGVQEIEISAESDGAIESDTDSIASTIADVGEQEKIFKHKPLIMLYYVARDLARKDGIPDSDWISKKR